MHYMRFSTQLSSLQTVVNVDLKQDGISIVDYPETGSKSCPGGFYSIIVEVTEVNTRV